MSAISSSALFELEYLISADSFEKILIYRYKSFSSPIFATSLSSESLSVLISILSAADLDTHVKSSANCPISIPSVEIFSATSMQVGTSPLFMAI